VRPFEFVRPNSLDEALAILVNSNGLVKPLAGGTDLIDQMKTGRCRPQVVLDIKDIPETQRLEYVPDEGLHIGAAVSCTNVAAYEGTTLNYPAIAEATSLIGGIQIQNRASVGGNICNGSPSADTVPSLLCYEGMAIIIGPSGQRTIPLEEFFLGPGKTVLEKGEMLLEVLLPAPQTNTASRYLRFIPREEMDIAVAGVGSLLTVDPATGRCRRARVSLAAVAPTPMRAKATESLLEGELLTPELIREAEMSAAEAISPITDVRGSGAYRRELVKVLLRRTLNRCLEDLEKAG